MPSVLDSWGRLASGMLAGTKQDYGSFDECILLDLERERLDVGFVAQYCSLDMNVNVDAVMPFKLVEHESKSNSSAGSQQVIPFRIGICVPSTCSPSDLVHVAGSLLHFNVSHVHSCQTPEQNRMDWVQVAIL